MSDNKISEERVLEALREIKYPGFPRDIVTLGVVARVELATRQAVITLRLPGGRTEIPPELRTAIDAALAQLGLATACRVAESSSSDARGETEVGSEQHGMPQVGAILAVFSAKGGVGKSTIATNLACAFARVGLRTGLLDADVYGPSLPILMGTMERPVAAGGKRFRPVSRHGVQCMSMGFFLDDASPVIWRGPMVAGLIQQFLGDCEWNALDVLVVDLPPGTGDASLTLAQRIRLSGAVIVTTPQEVAVRDVVRGVAMFRQLQVPILGVVENMSTFRCPGCGEEEHLFGAGGGSRVAELTDAPLLAEVPLAVELRERSDLGTPLVVDAPSSPTAKIFIDLADELVGRLGLRASLQPSASA